ncbi:MAG: S-adenosylmethionine decarboxylase [Candidatus Cyclobacteriaceae bacterium M3_2C_046]
MEEQQEIDQLMYNYQEWLSETDPKMLFYHLNTFLETCGYNILNFVEHHFEPEGYTCLWLLGESHLALHTFPDKGLTYLELSGCNREKNESFMNQVKSWINRNESGPDI